MAERRPKSVADAHRGAEEAPEDEDFFGRWSRRKHEARQVEPPPDAGGERADGPAVRGGSEPPAELSDADMPPLETLGEDSDYSGFLSSGVSDDLRKLALRKLFHLPSFNIRDGLDDYDEDFRFFEPLGDVITADMRHQMEREAERAKQMAAQDSSSESEAELARADDEQESSVAGEEARSSEPVPESDATDLSQADEVQSSEPALESDTAELSRNEETNSRSEGSS